MPKPKRKSAKRGTASGGKKPKRPKRKSLRQQAARPQTQITGAKRIPGGLAVGTRSGKTVRFQKTAAEARRVRQATRRNLQRSINDPVIREFLGPKGVAESKARLKAMGKPLPAKKPGKAPKPKRRVARTVAERERQLKDKAAAQRRRAAKRKPKAKRKK